MLLYRPRDEAHGPDGNATGSQVCWTNASLQAYMLMRAKECLRHDPGASIISISQLDNSNYCQDEHEAAIIAEEQSPAVSRHDAAGTCSCCCSPANVPPYMDICVFRSI